MHIKIHDSKALQYGDIGQGEATHTEIYGKTDEVLEALSALGLTVAQAVELTVNVGGEIGEDLFEPTLSGRPRLEYIIGNADVPDGRVTSTARRGAKWFNAVHVGDEVDLVVHDSGDVFGRAVIVAKEYVTYKDVLDNAEHNHVAFPDDGQQLSAAPARARLWDALYAAYGSLKLEEPFTVLHILPINELTDKPVT